MIKRSVFNRSNRLGGLIIILVWMMSFVSNPRFDFWHNFVEATVATLFFFIAFQLFKFYYLRLYKKNYKQYLQLWYVVLVVALIFFDAQLNSTHFEKMNGYAPEKIYYFLSITFGITSITFSMVLSLAFILVKRNKENELAISKLKALNKESELIELKNQLNPHFLFNALSNIYSIAYLGDKNTPDKILQLSKMLRYVIYETDVDFIPIEKEIEYLKDYIDFQRFKIKKEQKITFDYGQINSRQIIAPMLLLPFVENAFKHSQLAVEPEAWVKISLETKSNSLLFNVENTIGKGIQPEILKNNGIGLENIKKRLQLIYPDMHQLKIETNPTYNIYLKIYFNGKG